MKSVDYKKKIEKGTAHLMKRIRRDTNISILYLNISIIMYQNVPIELIERIEALERRMEKN